MKIGFIGNFDAPHSTENDRKWSFEKLGFEVVPFQENKTNIETLEAALPSLNMLMYSHTHGWFIPYLERLFETAKKLNIPTVSAHLDRWVWLQREVDMGKEATWKTEYIFMADGSPEAVELYQKLGLNWHWLKPGVIERDCYIAKPDRQRFPHDVIFVGSKNYHPEYPFRPKLVEWLHQTYGDRFGHYGGDGLGTVRGDDLNVLYASAKVVVGDSCFGNRPKYWSDRVTETIGRGGFLLHPHCEGMDYPMAHYNVGDLDDLKEAIDYWLKDDTERNKLRLKAHEHVKKNDTYTNKAKQIINTVFNEKSID